MSKWSGAIVCGLLAAVRIGEKLGAINDPLGLVVSVLLILAGVVWTVRGPEKLCRLSELYLWLAFVLSLGLLETLAHRLAGLVGSEGLAVFRLVSVVHLLVVAAALWGLGAWTKRERQTGSGSSSARLAAGLLILGAVIFWVGATTFPGLDLKSIAANEQAHLWTSGTFLLATVTTLAGLIPLTHALRSAGDRLLAVLGLVAFLFGAILWTIHLTFRLTVMIWAAREFARTAAPPPWFEPWSDWAGLLFGIYSVLAYLAIMAYGAALLQTRLLARWVGWTCLVFGLLAAPFVGPPLFIHVMPWFVGILLLKQGTPVLEPQRQP